MSNQPAVTSPPTNTPVKSGKPRTAREGNTLLAEQIRDQVHFELNNNQMVTDPESFLDKILPVPAKRVQDILNHLESKDFYRSNRRWKSLPTSPNHPSEISIYQPFVNIANAINNFVKEQGWVGENQIKGQWVNCSATPPTTTEDIKSQIRPDLAFVSVQTDPDILNKWQDDPGKPMTRSRAKKLKGETTAEDLRMIRWLQMLVVMEVKKDLTDANTEDALDQLCCYVREIFRHQADRSFVIGLTLCANALRVYLFDRSGVLGINRDIDINEDPHMIVQILAAFSLLHFKNIGWDATMSLYDSSLPTPVRSFSYCWKDVVQFRPQWVITMGGVSYVTLREVDTQDAQVMCGRATSVWEVCELSKFKRKTSNGVEILVLKQSWQRLPGQVNHIAELDVVPLEEYCYTKAGIVQGGLKGAEYVRDEEDKNIISTANWIRKQLSVTREPLRDRKIILAENTKPTTSRKSGSNLNVNPSRVSSSGMSNSDVKKDEWGSKAEEDKAFVDRRLTRILMKRRGISLSRFKDLDELVLAFKNGVKFHKMLYDAGILHRDVSPNNLLIRHHSQQTGDEVADLIDYDHAKIAEHFISWLEMQSWQVPTDLDDEITTVQIALKVKKMFLSLEAIKSCLKVTDSDATIHYLRKMFERFPSRYPANESGREMELKDLGLQEPPSSMPYFSPVVGLGQRTGTFAYMSHKILNNNTDAVHNAIHDIESFFWILVEYVLIHKGPGGWKAYKTEILTQLLRAYFDSGSHLRKSRLFPDNEFSVASKRFENDILNNIQGYFQPLRDLVEEWWKTLFIAYEFKGFELANIHFHIDAILDKALDKIRAMNSGEPHPWTVKEEQRRQRLDEAIESAFQNQRMVEDDEDEEEDDDAGDDAQLAENVQSLDIGADGADVFESAQPEAGPSRS